MKQSSRYVFGAALAGLGLTSGMVALAPGAVVINELYPGGGNAGSVYNTDFIELYNNGGATVDLSGLHSSIWRGVWSFRCQHFHVRRHS